MVTKDDEKYISNCLENIKEIVDEIVIVDVGSSDLTVDIAKKLGANVYQIQWENDYSKAKNFCLEQAKGRWVLFLQANETISKEQLKEIKILLDNPNAEGYLLYISHPLEKNRIFSPVQSLRLFRNRKEYRYRYRAFERIPDEILSNIRDSGIRVVQQYCTDLYKENYSRILLLEEELKEQPEDSYLQYMYGIELLNQQKYKESIAYFQKSCRNVNLDYLFAPHLYKCLSWSNIALQRYTDALDVLDQGIKEFPFYTDFFVLRGEVQKQLGQYEEAIRDLETSLKIREHLNSVVPRPEVDISVILEISGEIHEEVFNYQQALVCYQRSYELNKSNHKLLYKISELSKKTNSTEVLQTLLDISIKQNNIEQLMTLMDILFQQRKYTQVLTHLNYLESLPGKGEQIESIRFYCHMMLGEMEEAEIHFSSIDKESSLYSHMLLKRIESCWYHNQWNQAEYLIGEMNRIESIENTIKALYHLLHKLLTEKEICYTSLGEQEYEIVSTVLENFLWFEQTEKAQILLPLLLQEGKEDRYIRLAAFWAKRNDYQTIERIFKCISNKKKQLKFKQKIIEQLLRDDYIESAQKLMELGDIKSLGIIEYLLWSKVFMEKLKKWISKMHLQNEESTINDNLYFTKLNKPSKDLLDFYHNLELTKSDTNENAEDFSDEDMTCDKIYIKIGDLYIKEEKKKEALVAYLRAIQWNPLNELAQEKIIDILDKNFSQFYDFLECKCWILEGNWFYNKQDFINYLNGVIYFHNQQIEQSISYFLKISENKIIHNIVLAYITSSLWIVEKKEEVEKYINNQDMPAEFWLSFFNICKGYALKRLDEGLRHYPYSELIMIEKQRIQSVNFMD